MNLKDMMDLYYEEGLTRELASARVCQDIVLKAISEGPLNRNVTIKGGVVMRSITKNNRRATRDIDLDFIHYSLSDESMEVRINREIHWRVVQQWWPLVLYCFLIRKETHEYMPQISRCR